MKFDPKKLRVYNTKEACDQACERTAGHKKPVQLKNGRWAAMDSSEIWQYEQMQKDQL